MEGARLRLAQDKKLKPSAVKRDRRRTGASDQARRATWVLVRNSRRLRPVSVFDIMGLTVWTRWNIKTIFFIGVSVSGATSSSKQTPQHYHGRVGHGQVDAPSRR